MGRIVRCCANTADMPATTISGITPMRRFKPIRTRFVTGVAPSDDVIIRWLSPGNDDRHLERATGHDVDAGGGDVAALLANRADHPLRIETRQSQLPPAEQAVDPEG